MDNRTRAKILLGEVIDDEELIEQVVTVCRCFFGEEDQRGFATRIRMLWFNLRENEVFHERVNQGYYSPEELCVITHAQIKPRPQKQQHHQSHKERKSHYTCGKCHGNDVTYSQLQTRRGDEGFTNYFYCATCGNRWKQ